MLFAETACGSDLQRDGKIGRSLDRTTSNPRTLFFEASADPRIFLKARINESEPLYFILDSGSTWSFIDPSVVQSLGLKTEGQGQITNAQGDPIDLTFVKGVTLDISGAKFSDQSLAVAPMKVKFIHPVAGIIGSPFFKRFVVGIDYTARSLTLYEPHDYMYHGRGQILPLEFQDELPVLRVVLTIGMGLPVEARLMVDSGASWPVQLYRPFVEAKKLLTSSEGMLRLGGSAGLGGRQSFLVGRAKSVRLGRLEFKNQIVTFSQDEKGFGTSTERDGLIGTATLNRFRVVFDYARQRMIIEPAELFHVSFDYDLTGLTVTAEGKEFKVSSVYDGSRASKSGLQAGDVILRFDDRLTSQMNLTQFRQMFRQDGHEHILSIKRGTEIMRIKLQTLKVD